jgi:hypothetical protein
MLSDASLYFVIYRHEIAENPLRHGHASIMTWVLFREFCEAERNKKKPPKDITTYL